MHHKLLEKLSLLDKTGITVAILTASGWGMAGIFIKLLPGISAFSIVAVRLALALIIIIPILLFQNNLFARIKELRNLKVWLLSLIMLGCYIFGTIAFQFSSVGEVALLMTTAPFFVILFKFSRREKIYRNEYQGALIAFLGICFVIFPSITLGSSILRQHVVGNLLALLVSILFAIYAIWFRFLNEYSKAPSSMAVALGTFILGSSAFLSITIRLFSVVGDSTSVKYLMLFLGLGLVSTAIPTLSYSIAARRLPALITTSILLLEPILAIAFAFIVLRTVPSVWIIPGIILVAMGIWRIT